MLNVKSLHLYDGSTKLNVCAYARISRDKEVLETSLDEQIDFYTGVIFSNRKWNFAGIYADDGISGTSLNGREQFLTMIEKAKAGDIDIILVKSISRFARNVIDLLTIIHELRNKGVEVLFEREGISSLDVKCDTYLTMYSKFAEEEAISMSKNVSWKNEKDFRDGRYRINASQTLGFKYDGNRKVVIDKENAEWVRVIFKKYTEGITPAEICEFLEENHVKTGCGNKKWSSASVRCILRNEKYVGDALMQKYYIESPLTHKKLKNRGEKEMYIVRDGHEAIVERAVWNKAQEILNNNAKKFKLEPKNTHERTTAYTHFGYCPYCHSNYMLKWNRQTKMLYCGSNKSRRLCSKSESVFVDDLDLIIPMQAKILKDNEYLLKTALVEAFQDNRIDEQKDRLEALARETKALREKLSKVSRIKDESINILKEEIRKQISEKGMERMKIENDMLTSVNPEARARSVIAELRRFPNAKSIGNLDFRSLFKKVVICSRDKLVFILGSEDMTKLPKKMVPTFTGSYKYKIRKTSYVCVFGIYINR